MATSVVLIIFIGFFFLYHTSKRAEPLRANRLGQWIPAHSKLAQWVGLFLLMTAAVIAIALWGLAAGLLLYFVTLMTLASLVVVLGPIRVLGAKTLLMLSILSFFIETIFRYAG